jgi:hypothetical protein
MMKPIAAAGAIAASLLAHTPAKADVDFSIGFGFFPGFYDSYYDYPYYGYYGISCREGRHIVRHAGFRRVRAIDCRGRTFAYVGRRHGESHVIRVSRRSGRVVDVD